MKIYKKILNKCINFDINFYSYLPCSFNVGIINELSKFDKNLNKNNKYKITAISLVREESGVALSAGAYLGGQKTAMIIQSQGLGNMLTQMLAINSQGEGSYKIPNFYIISHRGLNKEKIQSQKPMGRNVKKILDIADISYVSVEKQEDLRKIDELFEKFERGISIALLVNPNYDENLFRINYYNQERNFSGIEITSTKILPVLSRRDAIKIIMDLISDEYIISNIGHPSRELFRIKDRDRNFYLLSSLGQAYMLAFGLAVSLNKSEPKIICFEGDGGLLMNSSSLSLLSQNKVKNLIIVIFDNGVYGSTGNLRTYAYQTVNLGALCQVYGLSKKNILISFNKRNLTKNLLFALKNNGPFIIHVIINDSYSSIPTIPLSLLEIKERFVKSLMEI